MTRYSGGAYGASSTDPPGDRSDAGVDPYLLPLMDALAQLTLAVDPAVGKARGLLLRPEYCVQHVKSITPLKQIDHTKLSYKDLVHGWCCMLQHLMLQGGDVKSYVGHCKFVAEQAMEGHFFDAAYVIYNRYVVVDIQAGPTGPLPRMAIPKFLLKDAVWVWPQT